MEETINNKNNRREIIKEKDDDLNKFIKKFILDRKFLVNNTKINDVFFNEKSINLQELNSQIKLDITRKWDVYINNKEITYEREKLDSEGISNKNIEKIKNNINKKFNEKLDELNISPENIIKIKLFSNQFCLLYMSTKFVKHFKKDIIDINMLRFPAHSITHKIFIINNILLSKLTIENNIFINQYKIGVVNVIYDINYTENKVLITYEYIWDTICNKNIIKMIINKIELNKNELNKNSGENKKILLSDIIEILFERIFLDDVTTVQQKCKYYYEILNNHPYWVNNLKLIYNIFYPLSIRKNIKNKNETRDDVLLISYNEDSKQFNVFDTLPIITKVNFENPKIIFVCTQESSSRSLSSAIKTTHYQHVLGVELKKFGYSLASKFDASKSIIFDTNVRTRVYYKNDDVIIFNNSSIEVSSSLLGKENKYKILTKNEEIRTKGCINCLKTSGEKINISRSKSGISGLGTTLKSTLYKGSIKVKMTIRKNDYDYKLIVVNSHLFYKHNGNTGINKRKEEMIQLIEEFNLINEWYDGYNVFFCGDLNFKIYPYDSKKDKSIQESKKLFSSFRTKIPTEELNNYDKKSHEIIEKYFSNNSHYKKVSSDIFKKTNELYIFLQEKYQEVFENEIKNNFYNNLQKSIDILGIHLTNKYVAKNDSLFYIRNKNNYARIPSMSDRILYSLSKENDIKISPYNFDILLIPNKSDHKMITLCFELIDMTKKNNANANAKANAFPNVAQNL
jgi:hypothetical protein